MNQDSETIKKKLRNWFKYDDYSKGRNFPLPLFVSKYNEIPAQDRKPSSLYPLTSENRVLPEIE